MKLRSFYIFPLFYLACREAPEEPILAQVGDRVITRAEFVQRAEFSPETGFHGSDSERAGYLLNLLVTEKLAAQAAVGAGLDTSAAVCRLTDFIEDMAMARELFRVQIREKVILDQADVDRAVARQAQTRQVAYLVFDEEALAGHFQQQLAAGLSFNAALRELYGADADTGANRRTIKWGENEPAIEDAAYALQPGQTSGIIAVDGAFMVMRLEEISTNPMTTESTAGQREDLARRFLRSRKEAAASDRFVGDFARGKNLQFNRQLVQLAARLLADQEAPGRSDIQQSLPPASPVTAEVIAGARQALAAQLGAPLASWTDGQITLGQVLEKWQAYNFSIDQTNPEARRRAIVRSFSLLVRDAMLAQEAKRLGLDKAQTVREEVGVWRDYYLATAWEQSQEREGGWSSCRLLLQQLLKQYPVKIDSAVLRGIELNSIPLIAIRPGQYNGRVTPPWNNFGM